MRLAAPQGLPRLGALRAGGRWAGSEQACAFPTPLCPSQQAVSVPDSTALTIPSPAEETCDEFLSAAVVSVWFFLIPSMNAFLKIVFQ